MEYLIINAYLAILLKLKMKQEINSFNNDLLIRVVKIYNQKNKKELDIFKKQISRENSANDLFNTNCLKSKSLFFNLYENSETHNNLFSLLKKHLNQ
jgi:hypothetical protein